MTKPKTAAVLLVLALAATVSATPAGHAATTYIPPNAERPRFGGEILLTAVGPVVGYWRTECQTWRIRSHARRGQPKPSPETAEAFKRFVSGLVSKKPDYNDMSPAMAEAVRMNLDTYWPSFNRMGRATASNQFDTDEAGNGLYVVNQAGGRTHWNITLTPAGKIDAAFICQGQGM
jgi:hypothetical protein